MQKYCFFLNTPKKKKIYFLKDVKNLLFHTKGVFVKKGTDAGVREALSEAFLNGFREPAYQTLLSDLHVEPLGLTGEEANAWIEAWRAASLSALNAE